MEKVVIEQVCSQIWIKNHCWFVFSLVLPNFYLANEGSTWVPFHDITLALCHYLWFLQRDKCLIWARATPALLSCRSGYLDSFPGDATKLGQMIVVSSRECCSGSEKELQSQGKVAALPWNHSTSDLQVLPLYGVLPLNSSLRVFTISLQTLALDISSLKPFMMPLQQVQSAFCCQCPHAWQIFIYILSCSDTRTINLM